MRLTVKHVIVGILLFMTSCSLHGTGLEGDVIYLEGEAWELLAQPVYALDSVRYELFMKSLPEGRSTDTANWGGFTCVWKVKHDSLYLRKVRVRLYDVETRKTTVQDLGKPWLEKVFAPYVTPGGIHARWCSGKLRAGKGELVRYVHTAFDRNNEWETVMELNEGMVSDTRLYHNRKLSGMRLQDARDELIRRFPWDRFPEYRGKTLEFWISDVRMSDDGRMEDVDIRWMKVRPDRTTVENQSHPAIVAFKQALQSIYPWEMLYIHNRYRFEFNSFGISIKEKPSVTQARDGMRPGADAPACRGDGKEDDGNNG